MHYYRFHIKDYRAKTAHLTPLEHYVYRTLIDWYYLNEKPFESIEQIARHLLLPLTDENSTAINAVLDEFFNLKNGKYYHSRIRQEVKDYNNGEYKWDDDNETGNANNNGKITDDNGKNNAKNNAKGNGKALSANDRQARYKERKKMLKALSDKGITLDTKASFDDVCNAYNAHFANTDNETGNANNNGKVTDDNGKNGAITNNHKPITNNQSNISPLTPQGEQVGDSEQVATDETHLQTNHTDAQTKQTTDPTSSSSRQSKSSAKSKSDKPKFDPKSYPLADTVDYELWCDFVDMRQSIKKPLTEQACKLLVKDFTTWITKGLSPNLAISTSIKNSWQGVFESHASPSNLPQPQSRPAWQTPSQPPVRDFAKACAEIEQHGNPILLNLQRAFGTQPPQPINVTPQEISHE